MRNVIISLILLLTLCLTCIGLASCTDTETQTTVPKPTSQGLQYNLNEDGSGYMVTGIGTCTDVYVVIPETHKDFPVTSIYQIAFYNNLNLKSMTIPNSVTDIGAYAFCDCSYLTKIIIPNSVTKIGKDAFRDCTKLTIYCEAESKPDGWDEKWNTSDCPVVWGYKG